MVWLPSKTTQLSNQAVSAALGVQFGYHLKQHNSQTRVPCLRVLVLVWLPSKTTQLSNGYEDAETEAVVWLPSKTTQLSNATLAKTTRKQFGYHLKQHNSQTVA